jgi:hypothetical protein
MTNKPRNRFLIFLLFPLLLLGILFYFTGRKKDVRNSQIYQPTSHCVNNLEFAILLEEN